MNKPKSQQTEREQYEEHERVRRRILKGGYSAQQLAQDLEDAEEEDGM